MLSLSRFFLRICPLALVSIFLFQTAGKIAPSQVSERPENSDPGRHLRMVIWTGHEKYSLSGSLRLTALLENTGDSRVYVDRRMFWTGLSGGLKLVISDEKGNFLPAELFSDAMMPPPVQGDTSILIPLESGFLYGTSVNLSVKGFFPKPGRYSLRVIYHSMLPKELVAPELRQLPALWFGTPSIPSRQVWIEVTQ